MIEAQVIGTLVTMGLQVGSSIVNMKYSKETTAKIKEMQQNFKQESQERNLRRDYEKFVRSCAFQLQIEEAGHKDRLGNIDQEFMNAIERKAYSDAISRQNYPLNISPYIIKKSVIPICGTQIDDSRKEVFCILTGSNDANFNKEVLPVLDDMLCELISQYWNQSSMHTICYYPNTWNVNFTYTDDYIANLKVILTTPTIAITPFFEKHEGRDELILKLRMWGIGNNEGVASQIKTGFVIDKLPTKSYETTQIKDIVKQVLPYAVCGMAQNIDVYYWTNYYQAPILPAILSKKLLPVSQETLASYTTVYAKLYEALALGRNEETTSIATNMESQLKDVAAINQFNFPQRSLNFLRSVVDLSESDVNSKIRIGVVGEFQSGKSLLINCLLKQSIAKIGDGFPTTPHTIVNYLYAEDVKNERVVIFDCKNEAVGTLKVEDFKKRELPDINSAVKRIDVYLNNQLLKDFILIDIPAKGYSVETDKIAEDAMKMIDYAILVASNYKSFGSQILKCINELECHQIQYYSILNCARGDLGEQGGEWHPASPFNIDLARYNRSLLADSYKPMTIPFEEEELLVVNLMLYWYSQYPEDPIFKNKKYDLLNNNKSLQEIERCSNFYLIEKIFSIENRKYIELKKKQFKGDVSFSGDLIQRTTLSIYEARTGHSVSELTDIDVAALMPDDFDTIIELIRIAKDCNASSQIKELTDIIRRKIAI